MKKVLFFLFAAVGAFSLNAQTFANAGMETWRSGSAGGGLGGGPTFTIQAPTSWYGFDSTIIEDGELFGTFVGAGSDWHAQLFEENTIVHGGLASAKLMTLRQDTFGYAGGIMSNAQLGLDIGALTGSGDPLTALTFTGGTPTTLRIMTVSAYVWFKGGIDTSTHMMGGVDSGMLAVQAVCTAYGADSVIGTGFLSILPDTGFSLVTANVHYVDTVSTCDVVRIIFSSAAALSIGGGSLDSSTLYVDDVSMTGVPQTHPTTAIKNVVNGTELVKVFPNPASETICFSSLQKTGLTATLQSINGQTVATRTLTGNDMLNLRDLPAGIYPYTITDDKGGIVQRGQISITR